MDSQDKTEVINKLIQLSEKIIFREPPFEDFVWPSEVSNNFIEKFHRYKHEISNQQRANLKNYIRKILQEDFYLRIGIALRSEPLADVYPDLHLAKEPGFKL